MCRACGAIVGAGQTDCAVCGASTAKSPAGPRTVADRETIRFARAILARPYKFTIILLAANFFVFLLMWQSTGKPMSLLEPFSPDVLIAYGAKLNELINQHQWWRLVTPMFIHINLLHLLVNMYSLWILGPYVEKLYGSAKFIVLWVVSGVGALVASYLAVVPPGTVRTSVGSFLFGVDRPSAGASGALFGLVGVLFVFGIKYRRELPEGFKRAFGVGLLPMILLNLFIGYIGRGLFDNAAHLGGLATGAALALVVGYRRPGERTGVAVAWQILRAGALVLVLLSFVKVAEYFPERNAPDPNADFNVFAKTLNDSQWTFYKILQGDSSGFDIAIRSLDSAPLLEPESAQLTNRLRALLVEAKEFKSSPSPSASPTPTATPGTSPPDEKTLLQEFDSWSKDYNRWLKTTGKTYGGVVDETAPKTQNNPTR